MGTIAKKDPVGWNHAEAVQQTAHNKRAQAEEEQQQQHQNKGNVAQQVKELSVLSSAMGSFTVMVMQQLRLSLDPYLLVVWGGNYK